MADDQHTGLLRLCTRCRQEKPATRENFAPHKLGKYGLSPRCRPCRKLDDAELRGRADQKARQKAWRDANKEKVREANRAYRDAGYKSTEAVAKWRRDNLDHARRQDARRIRERRSTDPAFALLERMRGQVRRMASGKGSRSTMDLLGFSVEELRVHLQRQFKRGMGWHNMKDWEIDHIIPVAAFNIETVDCPDFRACWALTNLQPLWKHENRAKSAKVLTLL